MVYLFAFILKIYDFLQSYFLPIFCFTTEFIYIDHGRVNGASVYPSISLSNRLSQVFYLPPLGPDLVVQVSCPLPPSRLSSFRPHLLWTGSWAAAVPVISVGRK